MIPLTVSFEITPPLSSASSHRGRGKRNALNIRAKRKLQALQLENESSVIARLRELIYSRMIAANAVPATSERWLAKRCTLRRSCLRGSFARKRKINREGIISRDPSLRFTRERAKPSLSLAFRHVTRLIGCNKREDTSEGTSRGESIGVRNRRRNTPE